MLDTHAQRADPSESVLDIRNARVFRGQKQVFDQLTLHVRRGETLAILGPNGAGKTTFLKLLTRELYPVARAGSHVRLFGDERVNIWQLRRKIGLVSHEFQIAYEAIASGLDVVMSAFFGSVGIHGHQHPDDEQRKRALAMLDAMNISELADKHYLQLSTGQQRRLLLARALVHDPEALLLDEPASGLDPAAAFRLMGDIRKYCGHGKTLILVTHHIQEIVPEIQRVVLLRNGAILADGTKEHNLTSDKLSQLYDYPMEIVAKRGFYQLVSATP